MSGVTGRVLRLEVENFKSYRGHAVIGPFKQFTTVIGPNGSGKSNLMDAISFVLGIRTGQLRGSNLRELLYVNIDSQDPEDHPDRGHVTLVFEDGNGTEINFTRAIVPASGGDTCVSQYQLDGKTVTAEAYNARLQDFNILVRARNFLVFQGDIENVAQMSPKDLTAMFETISGSAAIKEEYEAAELAMKDAEAAVSIVFSKRKAIAAEKRMKKEQKDEAERHMKLQHELTASKVRHALWKVFHIQEDAMELRDRARRFKADLKDTELEAAKAEEEVEAHRRSQASVAKERLLLDKKVKKLKNDVDKQHPALIKAREAIAYAERRLKVVERNKINAKTRAADHAAKMEALQSQLASLQQVHQQIEAELAAAREAKSKTLSPELLEEYNSIKRELGIKASAWETQKEALQASADADAEALRMIKDAIGSADERAIELEKGKVEASERLASLEEKFKAATKEREEKTAELTKLTEQRRRVESRKALLERRLEEMEGELREKKAEAKQSQREEALRALVEQLKRSFPGRVFGLVTDLAEATSHRYRLALSIVLGKDFDSVVVDTPETAMQCIQAVKERRLPPVTFLPAETIRVKEVNPALRALGGTSRLAIDTLNVKDERALRALQAVCGNTLLCDDVDEARRLAFGSDARHKVVALDGTAFLKTGLITGGVTQQMEDRAKRWDDRAQKEYGELKEKRMASVKELSELPTIREVTEAMQAAEASVSRLDNSLEYMRVDIRSTRAKVEDAVSAIEALHREQEVRHPDIARLEKQIKSREQEIEHVQKKIDELAETVFKDFSKKIGVKSIKEYEGKHLKEAERLAERRLTVSTQIARVTNQIEYELKANPKEELEALEQQAMEIQSNLESLRTDEEKVREAASRLENSLQEILSQQAELKNRLDVLDSEMKAKRIRAREAEDALASSKRALSAVQSRRESLKAALDDVLEAAELEGLMLPILSGRKAEKAAKKRSDDGIFAVEGTEMDIDNVDEPISEVRQQARSGLVQFDFSELDEDDRIREPTARARWELEMKATMDDLSQELERMAPNMKALEQFDEVKQRERAQAEEVETARKSCREATLKFNDLRQRRFDLFNAALSHITSVIDPIYKDLTRSALHPSGGQAYLAPENAEDPYSGGIKFSAMPPTKRFRDMEQLSGGEKTVAALALLFAVHTFRPSPFFVLDEIDAALDSTNVGKVATYVRSKTRSDADGAFQAIVISLKDNFYEKADALVGVCRNPEQGASETFTFDLERFGPPLNATA